jgi:hypothetical protein
MNIFNKSLQDFKEDRKPVKTSAPKKNKKQKTVSIVHSDIDLWLKAVDDLSKDLKELQAAKEKAKEKMSAIAEKNKKEKEIVSKKDQEKPKKERKFKNPFKKAISHIGNLLNKFRFSKKKEN